MDIRELLRHIRAGSSDRQIQRDMGVDRRTIKGYREWPRPTGYWKGPCRLWKNFRL
jgi:hypothetical protein